MSRMTVTEEAHSNAPSGSADTDPAPQEGDTAAASSSGREGEENAKLPCSFFLRTGTCAYGDRCKFFHPLDRPEVHYNSRGLPLRPDEPECSFYIRNGWCAFADTCKFHHPELPGSAAATGDGQQQQQQQQQEHGRTTGNKEQQQLQQGQNHGQRKQPKSGGHSSAHKHHPVGYAMQPPVMPGMPPGPFPAMYPLHHGHHGHHMLLPMGYYPAVGPHARPGLVPLVSSPMIHPVMHMRPVVSMAMTAPMGHMPMQHMQQQPPQQSQQSNHSSSGAAAAGHPGPKNGLTLGRGQQQGQQQLPKHAGSHGGGRANNNPRGSGGAAGGRAGRSSVAAHAAAPAPASSGTAAGN